MPVSCDKCNLIAITFEKYGINGEIFCTGCFIQQMQELKEKKNDKSLVHSGSSLES